MTIPATMPRAGPQEAGGEVSDATQPTLAERLDRPHRHLRLEHDDPDPHRTDVSVWTAADAQDWPNVTIALAPLFGQQIRFVDLTPDEARRLAKFLMDAADLIDAEVAKEAAP